MCLTTYLDHLQNMETSLESWTAKRSVGISVKCSVEFCTSRQMVQSYIKMGVNCQVLQKAAVCCRSEGWAAAMGSKMH